MAEDSTKVVYAALAGDVLVALSKFGAAFVSGSSAMLTEAIHSSTDVVNQILLLIGNKRSHARPDSSHAFGYGMEVYFWTFVVAVIVLLAGGVASIYEGVRRLASPEPITSPGISFGVLVLSAVFEGSAFAVGYRAYKRMVLGRKIKGQRVGMWRFIGLSKDPNLYETLLVDAAALIGIGLAALGVGASVYLNALWADGAASIAIGLLLIGNSLVIAEATRSLIAGESVVPPVLEDIRRELQAHSHRLTVSEIKTLHLGPRTILVALTIAMHRSNTAAEARRELRDITDRVRSVDERIAFVYFRFG
jgi:cation diffusion facilitator family transporter